MGGDETTPLFGYKQLAVASWGIYSPVYSLTWATKGKVDTVRAICKDREGIPSLGLDQHRTPVDTCMCGIYGCTDLYRLAERTYTSVACVIALIVGFGKVVVHEQGWRSEQARLVGIVSARESWDAYVKRTGKSHISDWYDWEKMVAQTSKMKFYGWTKDDLADEICAAYNLPRIDPAKVTFFPVML